MRVKIETDKPYGGVVMSIDGRVIPRVSDIQANVKYGRIVLNVEIIPDEVVCSINGEDRELKVCDIERYIEDFK